MFRKIILFAVLIILIAAFRLQGQTTFTYGNLIRVGFNQKEASPKDTLESWYDIQNDGYYILNYSKYFDHITTTNKNYFLKKHEKWFDSPYFVSYTGKRIITAEGSLVERPFGITAGAGWDVMSAYMIDRTMVLETKNGLWLISGDFNNAFLSNNDSLIEFNRYDYSYKRTMADNMYSILGKVGNMYLGAFHGQYYYDYYLVDLNNSPEIDSSQSTVRISFNNIDTLRNAVTEVRNLTGNLYAVSIWNKSSLDIYSLTGNKFDFVKTTLEGKFSTNSSIYLTQWEFRNGKLYFFNRGNLKSYDFNASEMSFINRKVLLDSLDYFYDKDSSFGIDRNFKYAARLIKDTLKILDIDKAQFINSIYVGNVIKPFNPIVDSPYVYVHQIRDQYTGVDTKETVVNSYSLAAYPNPFNSSVKIVYSIPEDSHAELTVYDMLGRTAAVLVNEAVKQGSHEILFNANHLSSGIYFYTLKAGKFTKTNKIILMK